MSRVVDDLLGWADRTPDAPFLIEEVGTVHTYADVLSRARRFAGGLGALGVSETERVLLLLPNGMDFLAAYYGTLLVGGTVVGLQPMTPRATLDYVVSSCRPALCVTDGRPREGGGAATVTPISEIVGATSYGGPAVGSADSIAQIIYTSGTTGMPKGVTLSHRALRANTSGIVEYLELGSSDRVGVVLDFVYSYGNSLLQTHCRVGGSLALLGDMVFPAQVATLLGERECTGFSGVPSTFALLLKRGRLEGQSLRTLRYLTCAGGSLPPANLRRLQRLLPDVQVYPMYGQTEAAARLSYLPPVQLDRRPDSIGQGMPGVTLEVLMADGRRAEAGEEGEIVASGENLMSGYWEDAVATGEVLRNGKLWTGDLARIDEEGFIYITGRRSDLIKTGAYRVHPKEIEQALVSMSGVHECVVVGVPDEVWGEVVVACFPRGTAPALPAARKHLRGVLPEYKWPRQVMEVDELPRTASGKPRRKELVRILTSA
ncbi:MAG: acyl--CoA ligase [Gemmatimonadota bacterium]|nr:acyl--CoA ligase [Gemmatimonadota bacterium]